VFLLRFSHDVAYVFGLFIFDLLFHFQYRLFTYTIQMYTISSCCDSLYIVIANTSQYIHIVLLMFKTTKQ